MSFPDCGNSNYHGKARTCADFKPKCDVGCRLRPGETPKYLEQGQTSVFLRATEVRCI